MRYNASRYLPVGSHSRQSESSVGVVSRSRRSESSIQSVNRLRITCVVCHPQRACRSAAGSSPGDRIVVRDGLIAAVGEHTERPAGSAQSTVERHVVSLASSILTSTSTIPAEPTGKDLEHDACCRGRESRRSWICRSITSATTTVNGLEQKRAAARGGCYVDAGFRGGVVPGNERTSRRWRAQVSWASECFLCPSGVEEFGPRRWSRI